MNAHVLSAIVEKKTIKAIISGDGNELFKDNSTITVLVSL